MIRHRDNWPTGSRFSARLAAVERALRRTQRDTADRNTGILDTLEVCIAFDVWDGRLNPEHVDTRFRRELAGAGERLGVRPDASILARIDRLREWARRTYRPE